MGQKVDDVLTVIPPEIDLLLPGDVTGLVSALGGYQVDVAVVCGLSWRLPPLALQTPRLGVINVHASLLPKYRGPAAIQWAIRNGDADIGVTAHWMDERIDTGNIIVQHGGIELPEYVTFEELWPRVTPVIQKLVGEALDRAADGYMGVPQNEDEATYARMMEPAYSYIDWSQPARRIHDQVRTFHYGAGIPGPFAKLGAGWVRVARTDLNPGAGVRVECADGPLWIVEAEPIEPPI
ncbi:methionyl-tRNA formyltransferase [Sphaerisporangium album]|uniref:Methionyl-tRNA formyltransferase n=1 Tax=Sphaerisporangium album TaxID=509200 RepID=A0A367FQC8_9ACTN|nr:formyltransferase family protein [Sphaerisporangium album]RCG31890.1 methionyl-tRNA formyltransferase [Sphaerisporangium album]